MQDEEQRRKRRSIFEFKQSSKINNSPYEIQMKNYIECYDKIMQSHPNYLTIFFACYSFSCFLICCF